MRGTAWPRGLGLAGCGNTPQAAQKVQMQGGEGGDERGVLRLASRAGGEVSGSGDPGEREGATVSEERPAPYLRRWAVFSGPLVLAAGLAVALVPAGAGPAEAQSRAGLQGLRRVAIEVTMAPDHPRLDPGALEQRLE